VCVCVQIRSCGNRHGVSKDVCVCVCVCVYREFYSVAIDVGVHKVGTLEVCYKKEYIYIYIYIYIYVYIYR